MVHRRPRANCPAHTEIMQLSSIPNKVAAYWFGGMALRGSPADFGQLILAETERSAKVISSPASKRNDENPPDVPYLRYAILTLNRRHDRVGQFQKAPQ